jgi:HlyD family type I secretion membrane fusion protein
MTLAAAHTPSEAAETAWRQPLRTGYAIIGLTFGVLGIWSAVAPLDSAVVGTGVVTVESNRKTVQHLEGGIVRDILVRDGDLVQAGDLLFRLDDTAARAQLDGLTAQLVAALAREARLLAERDGSGAISFPPDVMPAQAGAPTPKAVQDETAAFSERRAYLASQIEVQRKQQATARQEFDGLALEFKASKDQVAQIDLELPGLKLLLRKGYVALNRVTTLERERIRLQGIMARSQTDQAKASIAVAQADTQIEQISAQFQQTVATDLVDTRRTLADLRERLNVARDVLSRTEIRAPQAGIAQGRRIATVGAVIRSGDPLVDIAPVNDRLVIQGQIEPRDVNVVTPGMQVEVHFPGFKQTETPLMFGIVRTLSNDRVTDPGNNKEPYFATEIDVDMSTVPQAVRTRLRAGMDAEIYIKSGERSALRYILEPFEERLRGAFRER